MTVPLAPFNRLCDGRYGPMLYNAMDPYIGKSWELYGEYSKMEIDVLLSCVKPGDVVIDGGANIGNMTIPLAQAVGPKGGVIAFEPQRLLYHALVANIALNSLTNIEPNYAAIGNERGSIKVPQIDPWSPISSGGLTLDPDLPHPTDMPMRSVPIVPIDDFALRRCNLIKLDIEGMELDALKGAGDTIARLMPIIYTEATYAQKRAPLLKWLTDAGYECYWDTPPMFNENNYNSNTENVFQENGALTVSSNWLCVPAGRGIEVAGRRVTTDNLHNVGTESTELHANEHPGDMMTLACDGPMGA